MAEGGWGVHPQVATIRALTRIMAEALTYE
jgi:hypothetical protein